MTIPTIHVNGTPEARLLDQLRDAGDAARVLIEKLQDACPDARDYYPQGPDANRRAQAEHLSRYMRIKSVLDELQELALAVSDGSAA